MSGMALAEVPMYPEVPELRFGDRLRMARKFANLEQIVIVTGHVEPTHDAGHRACGRGDERETADHVSVDDVVVFASRRGLALTGQDLEEIAVEGLSGALRGGWVCEVAFGLSLGKKQLRCPLCPPIQSKPF